MKPILHKLSSRRGETLTEALCSVLIVALSSTVLASMIVAASHMNSTAIERDSVFYEELTAAEKRASSADGTVRLTVTAGGSPVVSDYEVYLHGASGALTTYSIKGGS